MPSAAQLQPSEQEYRRRIRAWTMYDWANSAFATTILAAVLPVYYSQVAGATLPSASVATAYWSAGLSLSLLIVAILSPILGTISDIRRNKKPFLSIFLTIGVVATGLLILVDTGDWLLASILFVLGRIGFTGANVFYDALLPHVAREEDQDRVSTRGYAMGYLGGGLLLAINVAMIQFLPGTWGPRLSFLSVGLWWAVFSIPLLRRVPEPPTATAVLEEGTNVIAASFERIGETLKDIRQYKELFKLLLAFLIYNDGIGTIIGVAAIYGAELGFGSTELILALLLVQFVGIPYSLIFGRLPSKGEKRRNFYLAFIILNLVALPVGGILGSRTLPADSIGAPPAPYLAEGDAVGQGLYPALDMAINRQGTWEETIVSSDLIGEDADATYLTTSDDEAVLTMAFNGEQVVLTYSTGPDYAAWAVYLDGNPLLDEVSGEPVVIDAYATIDRYGVQQTIKANAPGRYELELIATPSPSPGSTGRLLSLESAEVLPPAPESNLLLVLGLLIGLELILLGLAFLIRGIFTNLAATLDTKRSVLLALAVYAVISIWGFIINSVIEFWFLAWMVAVVQGGSQALSRSLYASMSPAAKSGEFFGLFGIMEKFSAIVGPLIFAFAVATFGSSRPAVLSIIAFFFVGGFLLSRVDVDEGRRIAREEDSQLLKPAASD